MTEKDLRKEKFPGEALPLERKVKDRARIAWKEIVRIRRVIIGIRPCVKMTKKTRDADSAKSASLGTERLAVSPTRSRRQVVEKVRLPC